MHLLCWCQNVIQICQNVLKSPLAHNLNIPIAKANAKAEAIKTKNVKLNFGGINYVTSI